MALFSLQLLDLLSISGQRVHIRTLTNKKSVQTVHIGHHISVATLLRPKVKTVTMLKNYFKIAWRNMWKQRAVTLIGIAGITIGIAAYMLMVQYASFELSYDDFHENAGRVYRVPEQNYLSDGSLDFIDASSPPALGPALANDFPEITSYVRLKPVYGGAVVSFRDQAFKEEKLFYADPSFFSFFSFPLLSGDPATALTQPNSIILTEDIAGKIFGNQDPVGKVVQLDGAENLVVTGVAETLPENTHLKFQALISMSTLARAETAKGEEIDNNWSWYNFFTYVMLSPSADVGSIKDKLPGFIREHKGRDMQENSYSASLLLQPLQDVHLNTSMSYEIEKHTSRRQVNILLIAAVFILVIAWINHVNFAAGKATIRANEVRLRRVAGASRWQLVKQFLLESVFQNIFAFLLALLLCYLVWPFFQNLTGDRVEFSVWGYSSQGILLFSLLVGGIFLTAFYPAVILSAFNAASGKNDLLAARKEPLIRKGLVIVQFTLSIAVIICTLAIHRQLKFMEGHDLWVDVGEKIVIPFPSVADSTSDASMHVFKDQLEDYPFIRDVSLSSAIPGEQIVDGTGDVERTGIKPAPGTFYSLNWVDKDFLHIFNIKLIAGKNFSDNSSANARSVIINEMALKALGFKSAEKAIGQQLLVREAEKTIIGVIRDFHQESLKEPIESILLLGEQRNLSYFTLQAASGDLSRSLEIARQNFDEFFPGNPFEYFFLDNYFDLQYAADRKFTVAFQLFTILTITIACFGLLGLAAFTAERRTREIGIRKVLGASVASIISLLSGNFIRLVLIAFVIAVPPAWYIINRWLQDFAYRIELEWWMFALAGLLAVMIALLTVSFQSVKTALTNPVKSLRSN